MTINSDEMAWQKEQYDLEKEITRLRADVERLRGYLSECFVTLHGARDTYREAGLNPACLDAALAIRSEVDGALDATEPKP